MFGVLTVLFFSDKDQDTRPIEPGTRVMPRIVDPGAG